MQIQHYVICMMREHSTVPFSKTMPTTSCFPHLTSRVSSSCFFLFPECNIDSVYFIQYNQNNVQILKSVSMLQCPQVQHTVFACILPFAWLLCSVASAYSNSPVLIFSWTIKHSPIWGQSGYCYRGKSTYIYMIKTRFYNVNPKNNRKTKQSCKTCCKQRWMN